MPRAGKKDAAIAAAAPGPLGKGLAATVSAIAKIKLANVALASQGRSAFLIVVEGAGDWVEQCYRPLLERKRGPAEGNLRLFYADDSTWRPRPSWAGALQDAVYLDKNDAFDHLAYKNLNPNVVFVATPDFTHSALAGDWVRRMAPLVFVEKPFDSQVGHVDALVRLVKQHGMTAILGLDHYHFYALPVFDLRHEIETHLGGALAKVVFYVTETRPIERGRERSLRNGMTMDLLPHLLALLTYVGDVSTVDDICVDVAAQYRPLIAVPRDGGEERDISTAFPNETYSRVEFTFHDYSGNGYRVPCVGVVGKGLSQEAKYLELVGRNGNGVRVDLNRKPDETLHPDYPWDQLFFLQADGMPHPPGTAIREVSDAYNARRRLRILQDPADPRRYSRPLERARYEKLIGDLLNGTAHAVASTLLLSEARDIVQALERIWQATQRARPWAEYSLGGSPPGFTPGE